MSETPTIGWRTWIVYGDGYIMSLGTKAGQSIWSRRRDLTAECLPAPYYKPMAATRPHDAPAKDCICGLRAMTSLSSLVSAMHKTPELIGFVPATWRQFGPATYRFREQTDSLWLPDIIGHVDVSGRILPGPSYNPPGTIRAERARLGKRLYLGWHLGAAASRIERRNPDVRLIVGKRKGYAWLDEIAEQEATHAA